MTFEFVAWPKIPRWEKEKVVITEKIDGTNACVIVSDDGSRVAAQSRSRVITPSDDNFGFAKWVESNQDQLRELGPGYHFGEWWGLGVQRGYGQTRKRFSLFNTHRWENPDIRPQCCDVVPVLLITQADHNLSAIVGDVIRRLKDNGSVAAPGFMKPEGVCLYYVASDSMYKIPFDK